MAEKDEVKENTFASSPEAETTAPESTIETAEKPTQTPIEETEESAKSEIVSDEAEPKMVPLKELQAEREKRREVESRLASASQPEPALPTEEQKPSDYVLPDGSIDWDGYNQYMDQRIDQRAQTISDFRMDILRTEQAHPEIKTDDEFSKLVFAYASANRTTLNEAADKIKAKISLAAEGAEAAGAQKKSEELTAKEKATTIGVGQQPTTDSAMANLRKRMKSRDRKVSEPAVKEYMKRMNEKQEVV